MNEKEFKVSILLLLLGSNISNKSSYAIVRILTRFFNIYDFFEVITASINDGLIVRTKIDNVEEFEISQKGIDAMSGDFLEIKQKMLLRFPNQKEYIDALSQNNFDKGNW